MKPKSRVAGFTLIELMVSIAILSLLTAILIPRLRLVTKERGIRETARMVGSQIVDAVIRAKSDGAAGIALVRNRNYFRKSEIGNYIYYSSSSIFQLRQRRPFCGNDFGDHARVSKRVQGFVYELEIPTPYDPTIAAEIVNGKFKYATIQLGSSSVEHIILNAFLTPGAPSRTTLQVQFHPPLPLPEIGQLFNFVISRRPEISATSEVVLPRGYHINLNYSGYLGNVGDTDNNTWTSFSLDLTNNNSNLEPIYILFDDNGGVDRIFTNGWLVSDDIPISSIYLCVAPDEPRHSFSDAMPLPRSYYDELTAAGGPDLLNEPSLIWVAVNHLNGSVGVGENGTVSLIPNPAPTGAALADLQELRIREARKTASKRRITNQ